MLQLKILQPAGSGVAKKKKITVFKLPGSLVISSKNIFYSSVKHLFIPIPNRVPGLR